MDAYSSPAAAGKANPEPTGRERRENTRVQLDAEIGFYSDSNFYTGFTQDLSEGGVFVATYELQPLGTQIEVNFMLPGGHELNVIGVVRWLKDPIEDTPGVYPGMGIQFVQVGAEDREAIQEFVQNRAPMFYDDDD